jgi:hypothetical protein
MSLNGRIQQWCQNKTPKISMRYLSELTGVSYGQIKELNLRPENKTTVDVIDRLYVGTRKYWPNDPLTPDIYLDYELFKIDENPKD